MPRLRIARGASAALILALGLISSLGAWAQEPETAADPATRAKVKAKATRRPRAAGPRMYKGRPIADVMSYQGAEWLVRPEREQEEQPEAMLDALRIRPGATVADVGAGVGYTSLRLARRVGPTGQVLATDVQPEMLRMMAANIKAAGVKNVRPIRATLLETGLPDGAVDLALMVDVYHECPDPEATLAGLRRALKPGGRLVLVEFRGEDPDVPIKPEHKMTVAQVRRELEPQGFTFKETFEFLPWQHILVFEKAKDDPKARVPATPPGVP